MAPVTRGFVVFSVRMLFVVRNAPASGINVVKYCVLTFVVPNTRPGYPTRINSGSITLVTFQVILIVCPV